MELKEVIAQELEKMKDKDSKITKEEFGQLVDFVEEGYRFEMKEFGDSLAKVIKSIRHGDLREMCDAMDDPGNTLYNKLLGFYDEDEEE